MSWEDATKTITLRQALEIIQNSKGKFFSVRFIARGDGAVREMLAQTNVKKYLKGGEAAYDFADHGLVSVYESKAPEDKEPGYKTIPREGITHLKYNGEWCIVKQPVGKLPHIPPRAEPKKK